MAVEVATGAATGAGAGAVAAAAATTAGAVAVSSVGVTTTVVVEGVGVDAAGAARVVERGEEGPLLSFCFSPSFPLSPPPPPPPPEALFAPTTSLTAPGSSLPTSLLLPVEEVAGVGVEGRAASSTLAAARRDTLGTRISMPGEGMAGGDGGEDARTAFGVGWGVLLLLVTPPLPPLATLSLPPPAPALGCTTFLEGSGGEGWGVGSPPLLEGVDEAPSPLGTSGGEGKGGDA